MAAALNSFSLINSDGGRVIVTGNNGGPWDIEFTGPDNGNRLLTSLRKASSLPARRMCRFRSFAGADCKPVCRLFQAFRRRRNSFRITCCRSQRLNPLVDPDNDPTTPNSTNVPSVQVLGGPGGPFTIIFNGTLAGTPGLTLQNATLGNTTTNNLSSINSSIIASVVSTPTPVVAVQAATPVIPPVNTEVQRILITGTPANEVQRITRTSNGSAVFSFNGVSGPSINLATSTTAAQIQANLRSISALAGNVNVTGNNGGPWTLTFVGSLAGQDVPDLVVESGGATAITTTQGNGNFRLTYGNTTLQSDVIRFSANPLTMAGNIQKALDSMFGAGNTVVTPVIQGTTAREYRIAFIRNLANANIPPLGVTGTVAPVTSIIAQTVFDGVANSVQTLTITPAIGTDPGGRIVLTYKNVALPPIDYEPGVKPSPGEVSAALNTLSELGGNVSVIGPDGGPFTIVLGNALAGQTVAQIRAEVLPPTPTNEVQRLTFTGTTITGGQFRLSVAGTNVPTPPTPIQYPTSPDPNAACENIQDALNAAFGGGNSLSRRRPRTLPTAATTSPSRVSLLRQTCRISSRSPARFLWG